MLPERSRVLSQRRLLRVRPAMLLRGQWKKLLRIELPRLVGAVDNQPVDRTWDFPGAVCLLILREHAQAPGTVPASGGHVEDPQRHADDTRWSTVLQSWRSASWTR